MDVLVLVVVELVLVDASVELELGLDDGDAGISTRLSGEPLSTLAAAAVTPVLLREPMAPHIAAARERREITLPPILAAYDRLRANAGFVVVEGVGGFRVPLSDTLDTADMAWAFALPMVVRN